ncbi:MULTISPECIES: GNAT family N-acetyltransferase [Pseudomonas]|uniref:GNAT family N-acetyltransferase n=1 Tax=Pseudomonas gingeri TaxID=117681 RepID=A0A7Y7WJ73_9PSED|nr:MULTISPECIES: GNAT family N-acetyltransferase [Pseudomonas]MCU1739770.1 GNAT family N-acetyltransferase [Pseudomonas sp. 20S_6.2_Bac1]NWB50299.1 GNAT family N-acetyltransferase [Pseudomonas gingeri]
MNTRLTRYDVLTPLQREQLVGLEVHPGQLQFCGDIQSALHFLPREPHDGVLGFVLLDNDLPVAFLLLKRHPFVPHWAGEGSATLHALQVDKRLQGRGFGAACLQALPEAARQAWPQVRQLLLSVGTDNQAAMSLYLKQGWVDSGDAYRGERRLTLTL